MVVKINPIFIPYRQDEPIDGRFFIIPKSLFSDDYKGLSSEAKLLYGLLLDRMELSRKNNFVDENGELYIFFEREEVKTLLETGKNRPTELFKELSSYGLIRERRQGVKKANIVYVGKVTPGNRESLYDVTPEKRESRLPEIGNLDSRKSGGSDPDLSDPDINDTEIKRVGKIPPALEEVIQFCKERGNIVNPEKWFNYYQSIGWMIGKRKMVDWKASIQKWEQDEKPIETKDPARERARKLISKDSEYFNSEERNKKMLEKLFKQGQEIPEDPINISSLIIRDGPGQENQPVDIDTNFNL